MRSPYIYPPSGDTVKNPSLRWLIKAASNKLESTKVIKCHLGNELIIARLGRDTVLGSLTLKSAKTSHGNYLIPR